MTEDDEDLAELEAFFNGPEFQTQVVDSRGDDPVLAPDFAWASADRVAGELSATSSIGRFLAGDGSLDPVVDQNGVAISADDTVALALQARTYLALAFKKSETALVAHRNQRDEFDTDVQQMAFDLIHARVRRMLANASGSSFWSELTWLFGTTDTDREEGIPFELACEVLSARVEVFRLRIMYEFWLRWTIFPAPVAVLAESPPKSLLIEAEGIAQGSGRRCLMEAWMQPGIVTAALVDRVVESYSDARGLIDRTSITEALLALEAECLVSQNEGHWYCTGRNPAVRDALRREAKGWGYSLQGGSFNWSRLFGW